MHRTAQAEGLCVIGVCAWYRQCLEAWRGMSLRKFCWMWMLSDEHV